ncbi:hypothetical protein P691DRAFT_777874 [Macrolepiota fuliginosa MF-IS2]|uniref:F-box domain-containing protein n=1 Tax=Macrolepiota fuliginosa MF-IS2 TaxID=1400762 RepID=A0A9P5X7Y6_9AGAR|nr:hypothetical protein P691DRAFT_777874 [Macrolepiota fuliginosa MF-IS2]
MSPSHSSGWAKVSRVFSLIIPEKNPLSSSRRSKTRTQPLQHRGLAQENLPFDILSNIFETYTGLTSQELSDLSNKSTPWILGHICRSWREAALSIPQCWNVFAVVVTDENANSSSLMHEELIRRSGTMPLHISFNFRDFTELIEKHPFQIIEPVLKHSSQWGTVVIIGMDCSEIHRQFGPVRGQISRLRSLRILRPRFSRGLEFPPGERRMTHFDLFAYAPSLSEVTLEDPIGSLEQRKITLPWNQLTQYVAHGFPEGVFPVELERSPDLQSLMRVHNHFPPSRVSNPISHHHLRYLFLHGETDMELAFKQLGDMTLPSLEVLAITFATMEARKDISAISAISSLVTRSHCQLKALVIQQTSNLYVDLLPPLLSQLPSLETLDIGHCGHFRGTFSALRFDPTRPTLLPNLRRLVVSCNSGTRPSDIKLIKDILHSRQRVSKDNGSPGQLLAPLLYARLFVKKNDLRYHMLLDLEGWRQLAGPTADSYPYSADSVKNFSEIAKTALEGIRHMIEASHKASGPRYTEIAAKYTEISKMYYAHTLYSMAPGVAEELRSLCNVPILSPYLDRRRWMMTTPSNLLYIHPQHSIRTSTRKSDMVVLTDFPGRTLPDGYHYWLGEHTDKWFDAFRLF